MVRLAVEVPQVRNSVFEELHGSREVGVRDPAKRGDRILCVAGELLCFRIGPPQGPELLVERIELLHSVDEELEESRGVSIRDEESRGTCGVGDRERSEKHGYDQSLARSAIHDAHLVAG